MMLQQAQAQAQQQQSYNQSYNGGRASPASSSGNYTQPPVSPQSAQTPTSSNSALAASVEAADEAVLRLLTLGKLQLLQQHLRCDNQTILVTQRHL